MASPVIIMRSRSVASLVMLPAARPRRIRLINGHLLDSGSVVALMVDCVPIVQEGDYWNRKCDEIHQKIARLPVCSV